VQWVLGAVTLFALPLVLGAVWLGLWLTGSPRRWLVVYALTWVYLSAWMINQVRMLP
jgi:hypothetical protein